jgi:hypothetical protein
MVKPTVRQATVPPKTFDPRLSQSEGDAAQIFEIDRSTVVFQLRSLRSAIDHGAEEMEMVAAEKVFVKSVSRALTHRARTLRLAAKDLNRLLRLVERAQVPKAPERLQLKPTSRNRRKARN